MSEPCVSRKSYEAADRDYTVVEYEGILSGDGTEIEGRWTIPGNCSGTFLMIRSSQIKHRPKP